MTVDTLDAGATRIEAPVRFAGFGVRLGSAIIDFLVMLPLVGGITYFTIFSPNFNLFVAVSVLSMLYKPLMEGYFGATVGKMATKIKVVAKENEPITMVQAVTRAAPWILGSLLNIYFTYQVFQIPGLEDADGFTEFGLIVAEYQAENGSTLSQIIQQVAGWLPLISALVMLGNKQKQSAHDLLAETYVVYKNPEVKPL
ncbi:RDD family protein [Lewinella sp. 4G2]|uniref:RDD family protein n=1 Tax=Lewinella sp. 4G2 TaxID=1803372 RepID=UPI0007B4639F|nr:RDD family protein [Lewinella sp. 4G2]OAV45639.1 hypothetical protein A3850_014555 [Lewinella sp. 4G2]